MKLQTISEAKLGNKNHSLSSSANGIEYDGDI